MNTIAQDILGIKVEVADFRSTGGSWAVVVNLPPGWAFHGSPTGAPFIHHTANKKIAEEYLVGYLRVVAARMVDQSTVVYGRFSMPPIIKENA
jgi:hypothetical protein